MITIPSLQILRLRSGRPFAFGTSLPGLALGCAREPAPIGNPEPDRARAMLEQSAAALRGVTDVSYAFEWGGEDNASGWVTGNTSSRRITDAADSWVRVEGTVHAQPAFGVERVEFRYATDGELAWAEDSDTGRLQRAPVGDGANTLSANAVYGFLPEFIEARPFWKELELRSEMTLLAPEEIDGEACDVVQVRVFPEAGEPSDVIWSIARSDHLPRRGRWPSNSGGPTMVFTIRSLSIHDGFDRAHFRLDDPAARDISAGFSIGARAPDFELATPDGRTIRLQELAGKVVVADFWNTWCYLCRSIAPRTRELAVEMSDRPVQFLGINVFETGDPVPYWQQVGDPYPLLLDGDELAQTLDLPWQPGVVVIGPEGSILYKELGASPDRAEKIRAAIERGLATLHPR